MSTNKKLLDYHRQNQDLAGTVVGDLYLKERIKDFTEANQHQLDFLVKTLNNLQKEYFVHDEKGELQFEGEGRDRKPKIQFGLTPEEYTERREKILAIPYAIKRKFK